MKTHLVLGSLLIDFGLGLVGVLVHLVRDSALTSLGTGA